MERRSPRWCWRPACRSRIRRRTGPSQLAHKHDVEIIGDIELFCRERAKAGAACPLVAITGTNGKSTTTALVTHLIKSAGYDAQMGGNIGVPVLALESFAPNRVYVLEVSSYQIDLSPSLHATVGILTNVTEDHLDRHGTMENYAAIKERLPAMVEAGGTAVIGVDDHWTREAADRIERAGQQVARVSVLGPLRDGYYAQGGDQGTRIMHATGGKAQAVAELAGIGSLRGSHNAQNAACAIAACVALGIDLPTVQKGLASFAGLAHRMQQVGRKSTNAGGILYVNDSKATNADSAAKALASFHDIFWIAGGKPKTGGIVSLEEFFPRIRKAYLIGEAAEEFAETLERQSAVRDRRRDGESGRSRYPRRRCLRAERAGGAALARLRLVRPVPQFRSARKGVHGHCAWDCRGSRHSTSLSSSAQADDPVLRSAREYWIPRLRGG